jgi:hypothetical protein
VQGGILCVLFDKPGGGVLEEASGRAVFGEKIHNHPSGQMRLLMNVQTKEK